MFDTWTLAVFAEMNSLAAMSGFDRPSATRRSTSNSLAVRPSGPGRGRVRFGALAGRLDPRAAGRAPDRLPQGARAELVGDFRRATKSLRRAVAVPGGQRPLGGAEQRDGPRVRLPPAPPRPPRGGRGGPGLLPPPSPAPAR